MFEWSFSGCCSALKILEVNVYWVVNFREGFIAVVIRMTLTEGLCCHRRWHVRRLTRLKLLRKFWLEGIRAVALLALWKG